MASARPFHHPRVSTDTPASICLQGPVHAKQKEQSQTHGVPPPNDLDRRSEVLRQSTGSERDEEDSEEPDSDAGADHDSVQAETCS